MNHVENVGIEEIVEIIRDFAKHDKEVVDKKKTSVVKGNHEVVNNVLLFDF